MVLPSPVLLLPFVSVKAQRPQLARVGHYSKMQGISLINPVPVLFSSAINPATSLGLQRDAHCTQQNDAIMQCYGKCACKAWERFGSLWSLVRPEMATVTPARSRAKRACRTQARDWRFLSLEKPVPRRYPPDFLRHEGLRWVGGFGTI